MDHTSWLRHFPPTTEADVATTGAGCAKVAVAVCAYSSREIMIPAVQQLRKLSLLHISKFEAFTRVSERTFRIRAVARNKGKHL